ncbi:MAG: NAD(P)-dependent oxidoreductase [Muribaculaceae bacterium]|nr:NAD(P)-dependent oxidoreductase [Muribaculaceae bacterium]
MDKRKVLVVGAGGFAGGFIVEEGLRRGCEVYAGVRETTSRKYLADSAIKFVTFDFDNPDSLAQTIEESMPGDQKWDWIVYNLGATKAISFSDFSKVNYEYLKNFLESLKATGKVPDKFLLMSSLSVHGPSHEKDGAKFRETDIPAPNTRYGASKLKAEMLLQMEGIPYIIFRPTGIYGPRDKDYYLMLQSISKGFDFSAGYKKQLLTFIYVEDLARAVFDALEKAPAGNTYIISEDKSYTQKEFRKIAAEAIGRKHVLSLPMPLWAVKAVSAVAEKWGVARMKPSTLNRDKYNIMKQRNWDADVSKAKRDFGFNPMVSLKEGVRNAADWYKKEGWL